jgi:hypothetical protein
LSSSASPASFSDQLMNRAVDFRSWHETDLPRCPQFCRYRGESGHGGRERRLPSLTQMYGPAVRCKGISMRRWQAVLHQCIRPLIRASCSGLIMDISAPAFSLADRPQRTIWVTRFRMRREDRTSISFSSSRRPWRVNELLANATRLEACWPRRCDCELARSMRCVRACWRARSQARCGGVASWPPRSNA